MNWGQEFDPTSNLSLVPDDDDLRLDVYTHTPSDLYESPFEDIASGTYDPYALQAYDASQSSIWSSASHRVRTTRYLPDTPAASLTSSVCSRSSTCDTNSRPRQGASSSQSLVCAKCGWQAERYPELEAHGRDYQHSPFRCTEPSCQRDFRRRDTVLRHENTQHVLPLHNCPECGKSHKRRDHLQTHMRRCHGKRLS